MAKKRVTPTQESAVKRDLRTPKYQMRVVQDKTRYNRKKQGKVGVEGFRKAA